VTDGGLRRMLHRTLATGTVRTGSTGHGESLADVEFCFTTPEQNRVDAMLDAGVAQGLTAQATAVGRPDGAAQDCGWAVSPVTRPGAGL